MARRWQTVQAATRLHDSLIWISPFMQEQPKHLRKRTPIGKRRCSVQRLFRKFRLLFQGQPKRRRCTCRSGGSNKTASCWELLLTDIMEDLAWRQKSTTDLRLARTCRLRKATIKISWRVVE